MDFTVMHFRKWYEPGRSNSLVREGRSHLRGLKLARKIFKSNRHVSCYKNTMTP